jgi:ArsR family transcriptional regulator
MEKLDALAALAALAQESRLDVFRLLVQAGADGMPAGQIGERLGLPSATLSFHLNHLKQSGLVKCRRESRSLIYRAEYAATDLLSHRKLLPRRFVSLWRQPLRSGNHFRRSCSP